MPLLRGYRDGEPTELQICRSYGATGMVNRRSYRYVAPTELQGWGTDGATEIPLRAMILAFLRCLINDALVGVDGNARGGGLLCSCIYWFLWDG